MTSLITRFAGATFSALLTLGALWPFPAAAESVPASFDCAKAGNTVEKLICSQAVLRWQDQIFTCAPSK